ncbi:MAG: ribonuclease [Oscillospiraceae bacterium]|nr:ribonuclease [Oscillospiraceae bacterium]
MKKITRLLPLLLVLLAMLFLYPSARNGGTSDPPAPAEELLQVLPETGAAEESAEAPPAEDGSYTTKEDVSRYLQHYGRLPSNFVTKKQAEAAGWTGGGLDKVLPGKCIGGDRFGNYEGLLPDAAGRKWTECDINTLGKNSRGAERLVFSNDGLIYYTGDHYDSFELLYGDPAA